MFGGELGLTAPPPTALFPLGVLRGEQAHGDGQVARTSTTAVLTSEQRLGFGRKEDEMLLCRETNQSGVCDWAGCAQQRVLAEDWARCCQSSTPESLRPCEALRRRKDRQGLSPWVWNIWRVHEHQPGGFSDIICV